MLETEPQIIAEYIETGKVRLIYRHLLQLGERSEQMAEYSECAADQGRFWEMRRALYAVQSQAYADLRAAVAEAATTAGADIDALEACASADTYLVAIRADHAAATAEGIRSRPVFVVGEHTLVGAQPIDRFKQLINAALGGT